MPPRLTRSEQLDRGDGMKIETHDLEQIPIALRRVLAQYEEDNITTHLYRDITGNMIIEMRATMYGEKSAPEEVIRWPADWIQAFKLAYFSDWLLRLFPIVWKERKIKHMISYPDLLYKKIPAYGKYVRFSI